MTQDIISEWADIEKTRELLESQEKLNKLAYDFCKKFGVFVSRSKDNSRSYLDVLTKDGLNAGTLRVDIGYVRGKSQDVYIYSANHITKDRSSANSNNRERDSSKINTLLKSIEKNNEEPSTENIYKEFVSGVHSAFETLREREDRQNYINAGLALAVFHRYSMMLKGEPTSPLSPKHHDEMMDELSRNKKNLRIMQDNEARFARFARGCTVIGTIRGKAPPYNYYVGTVKRDEVGHILIENLVRHASVRDIPHLAGVLAMLREYFKGNKSEHYDSRSDVGCNFHDEYHSAMDIACGYSNGRTNSVVWTLIPNEPPVSV